MLVRVIVQHSIQLHDPPLYLLNKLPIEMLVLVGHPQAAEGH